MTKLDRLARSLPDARDIADELTGKGVALSLGGSVYDPGDPVGQLPFNVLGMVAECEADLIRMRTREGMQIAKAAGRLRGKQPTLSKAKCAHLLELAAAGGRTQAELAGLFDVSRTTDYRELCRAPRKDDRAAVRRENAAGGLVPRVVLGVVRSIGCARPRRGR